MCLSSMAQVPGGRNLEIWVGIIRQLDSNHSATVNEPITTLHFQISW